ncbi:5495_t:CDS:2 [Dentiscutata heterogama]|uniref:5495_t:CDS:1 n=1 Tax=Dentiscutata heterogama TaxID=1316150 RepID=A0ACA9K1A5_9GLOM|nr:5495_t:CDS:2 [Dentiscutata heterogama]
MEDVTSNEETSIGRISNNEETSINRISSDPVLLSDTESTQSELNSSIKLSHKGDDPKKIFGMRRAQNMKSHLALKCKGKVPKEVQLKILRDIQSKDEHVLENEAQVFDRSIAVKNLIINRQFWIDAEQLRNILGPVKQAVKDVEFRTTLLADVFVELVKMAITIQETSVLYNNQFRRDCISIYNKHWNEFDTDLYLLSFFLHPAYRGNFLEPGIYKKHVQKKALEIWKQLGGGDISADFLKAQMNLYKNKKHPFDDEFVASVDTVTNWWMSIDLKNNEEHIKRLAMKLHSISPHNAACERLFSILGWYFGKRRTRRVHFSLCCIEFKLSLDRLEIMAQMHSYLVENVGSELNYIEQDFRQEDFLAIFNKIASSMEDGSDLFSEEESFSYHEELSEQMEEDVEELSELDDLVGENSTKLEVENIINLSSKLEINESSAIEEIVHGNKDFDVNDLLSDDSD